MKRWEYNTLKAEVIIFFLFLAIMIFELMGVFYIFFYAEKFCYTIAMDFKAPYLTIPLAWLSRLLVIFYMYLAGCVFYKFAEKQDKL